jgi:hypothetical protein
MFKESKKNLYATFFFHSEMYTSRSYIYIRALYRSCIDIHAMYRSYIDIETMYRSYIDIQVIYTGPI